MLWRSPWTAAQVRDNRHLGTDRPASHKTAHVLGSAASSSSAGLESNCFNPHCCSPAHQRFPWRGGGAVWASWPGPRSASPGLRRLGLSPAFVTDAAQNCWVRSEPSPELWSHCVCLYPRLWSQNVPELHALCPAGTTLLTYHDPQNRKPLLEAPPSTPHLQFAFYRYLAPGAQKPCFRKSRVCSPCFFWLPCACLSIVSPSSPKLASRRLPHSPFLSPHPVELSCSHWCADIRRCPRRGVGTAKWTEKCCPVCHLYKPARL